MKTELRRVIIGNFCTYFKRVTLSDGRIKDFSNCRIVPQKHHVIVTTEDGYKLALNPYNDIAYLIIGENYQINL